MKYDCHGLDTDKQVCFYEQEFYPLSNFSSFQIRWGDLVFPTSEHLYHWLKFGRNTEVAERIRTAPSAHEAFKLAETNKDQVYPYWPEVRVRNMLGVLRLKVAQHEYVRRKLLQTGDRKLVENSWRDPFWGSGGDHLGTNALGRCWMLVRDEVERAESGTPYSKDDIWEREERLLAEIAATVEIREAVEKARQSGVYEMVEHQTSLLDIWDPATGASSPAGLFVSGEFTLHSGERSDWKINCDALTDGDIETLARELAARVGKFGQVYGIPRGGDRIAKALRKHSSAGPRLVVDDVWTTGASMDKHARPGDLRAVLFARTPPPEGVVALFVLQGRE